MLFTCGSGRNPREYGYEYGNGVAGHRADAAHHVAGRGHAPSPASSGTTGRLQGKRKENMEKID